MISPLGGRSTAHPSGEVIRKDMAGLLMSANLAVMALTIAIFVTKLEALRGVCPDFLSRFSDFRSLQPIYRPLDGIVA